MESSSHITGEDDGGEGCNSCESGWTMYLASPMHMHGRHGHDDDAGGSSKGSGSQGSSVDDGYGYIISGGKKGYEDYADADDDDSLASDASTGPAKAVKSPSPSSLAPERQHGGKGDDEDDNDDHHGKEEQEEGGGARAKFAATSSRKKAAAGNGKVDKGGGGGDGNSSRRGHSKRGGGGGGSSRRSFFLW